MANYSDHNQASYTGRIVADARTRDVQNAQGGTSKVSSFTIAVNRSFMKKGASEPTRKTVFIDCTIWNRDKLAQYLTKGKMVLVSGETEEARVGSNGKAYNQLTVRQIQFFQQSGAYAPKAEGEPDNGAFETPIDDDIPF